MKEKVAEFLTTPLGKAGPLVVAKRTKYGVCAKTFSNRTQANNAAAVARSLGHDVAVVGNRPFYVRLVDIGERF